MILQQDEYSRSSGSSQIRHFLGLPVQEPGTNSTSPRLLPGISSQRSYPQKKIMGVPFVATTAFSAG
jgi:hypothetical protein